MYQHTHTPASLELLALEEATFATLPAVRHVEAGDPHLATGGALDHDATRDVHLYGGSITHRVPIDVEARTDMTVGPSAGLFELREDTRLASQLLAVRSHPLSKRPPPRPPKPATEEDKARTVRHSSICIYIRMNP